MTSSQTSNLKSGFSWGSVAVKFSAILLILMSATVLAIGLAYVSFNRTQGALSELTEIHVPATEKATHIVGQASLLKDQMTSILLAEDKESLDKLTQRLNKNTETLGEGYETIDGADVAEFKKMLADIRAEIGALHGSRSAEFDGAGRIEQQILTILTLSEKINGQVETVIMKSQNDLILGGRRAIGGIDDAFKGIFERDIVRVLRLLEIRAEMNLLSGLSVAVIETTDPKIRNQIKAQVKATIGVLDGKIKTLEEDLQEAAALENPPDAPNLDVVRDVMESARYAITAGQFSTQSDRRNRVFRAQAAAVPVISEAVSIALENLDLSYSQTSKKSASAIETLLKNEVAGISDLDALNLAISHYVATAVEVATISDDVGIKKLSYKLSSFERLVERYKKAVPDVVKAEIDKLLQVSDEKTGIIANRLLVLEKQKQAEAYSQQVAGQIFLLASSTEELGNAKLGVIKQTALSITQEVKQNKTYMVWIAIVSGLVFVLTQSVTYFTIVVPIIGVTKATERIAEGRLYDVWSARFASGEVARMTQAITTLRNGLIEKNELEAKKAEMDRQEAIRRENEAKAQIEAEKEARKQEEKERIAAAEAAKREREEYEERAALKAAAEQERQERILQQAEAERKAERERQEREEALRIERQEQEKRLREKEAQEREEREALREQAEKERQQRHDEQNAIVAALAEAINKLAAGNLNAQIDTVFAGPYEQLRHDFNRAVQNLDKVVGNIASASGEINMSSNDILHMASEASQRAENMAQNLESTASALEEMTSSVRNTSLSAEEVNVVVQETRKQANEGDEVVKNTISVMGEIEESSSQIAKITDVIDDIAFQTNLLALNAGVEAARAGEAGRGFAVVAAEVRSLAQRSSDAAREISQLISTSGTTVQRGVDMVGKTGNVISSITESIDGIATRIEHIVVAAREQSHGVTEINSSVTQIDQASQQNASSFTNTTKASQQMQILADSLAETISSFSTSDARSERRHHG